MVPEEDIKAIADSITENIDECNGLASSSSIFNAPPTEKPYEEREDISYEDIPSKITLPPGIKLMRALAKKQPLIAEQVFNTYNEPPAPKPRIIPKGMALQGTFQAPVLESKPRSTPIGFSARKLSI